MATGSMAKDRPAKPLRNRRLREQMDGSTSDDEDWNPVRPQSRKTEQVEKAWHRLMARLLFAMQLTVKWKVLQQWERVALEADSEKSEGQQTG